MRALLVLLFALGCSSSTGRLDRSSYDLDVCKSGRWDVLGGVTVADGSYLELDISASGTMSFTRQQMSRVGTACASASEPTTCTAALAKVTSATGWRTEQCGGAGCTTSVRWFVREKAGAFTILTRIEDLLPYLGAIDSPAKAAVVAAYRFGVDDVECSGAQVKRLADGSYEVFLAHGDSNCTDRVERRVRVLTDGTATVVESATIPARETCVSA